MNLQQLKHLSVLAQARSYTQAAKILHIAQPTLSYSIMNLEKELGVQLINKQGRNISLTEEGKIFNEGALSALQILEKTTKEVQSRSVKRESITIASLRILFHNWLPTAIKDFQLSLGPDLEGPLFKFTNSAGYSGRILDSLYSEKCDLAFCSKINDDPDVDYYPIVEQKLVLITPTDHPLAEHKNIDLQETLDYPQITFAPTTGLSSELEHLFSLCNGTPKSAYSVEEDEAVAGMVAAGFGIGIVPEMNLLKQLPIAVIPIRYPQWHRLIYMATLKKHYQSPQSQQFISFIKDQIHEAEKITQI